MLDYLHGHRIPYSSTSWGGRTLRTGTVAALLGIQPASLYQLVLRKAFPEGTQSGRERAWRLDAVADFVLEHRRHAIARLPRLIPRAAPIPALYCGARSFTVTTTRSDVGEDCVAYVWQPSDGGSQVALVYAAARVWQPAADVLASVRAAVSSGIEAVMVVEGDGYIDPSGNVRPPDVQYADTAEPVLRLPNTSWFDLAYLLQVDLPWWPQGLRDEVSMLGWQPGSRPDSVVPRSPVAGDPFALLRLGATARPENESEAVQRFCEWFAERCACFICPPTKAEPELVSGICIAAHAIAPHSNAALSAEVAANRGHPTPPETARILHSRVDPAAFDEQVRVVAHTVDAWSPLIERVVAVQSGTANPLARQFLNCLRESEAPADELGFLIVAARGLGHQRISKPLTVERPRRLAHPLDPDLWIARYGDVVYVSVPQLLPAATGVLQQLDITQDGARLSGNFTAWWTDSAGNAWPLPGHDDYEAGFDGNGPRALAAAATALAVDAAGSMDIADGPARDRHHELVKFLVAENHPILIRRLADGDGWKWQTSGLR